jgi:hypothetical protein
LQGGGGNGGLYGGGGGGSGGASSTVYSFSGSGGQGAILITYTSTDEEVFPLGVESSAGVSSVVASIPINVTVEGVSASTSVGVTSFFVGYPITVYLGGTSGWNNSIGWGLGPWSFGGLPVPGASGFVGTVDAVSNITALAVGVSGSGVVGSVQVNLNTIVLLDGLSADGIVGDARSGVFITIFADGVEATGIANFVSEKYTANVFPVGVFASGASGEVVVWISLGPGPVSDWTEVFPQTSGWYSPPSSPDSDWIPATN